jgi:hypothetical protein
MYQPGTMYQPGIECTVTVMKWVEARDASMAAWADEVTGRGR